MTIGQTASKTKAALLAAAVLGLPSAVWAGPAETHSVSFFRPYQAPAAPHSGGVRLRGPLRPRLQTRQAHLHPRSCPAHLTITSLT